MKLNFRKPKPNGKRILINQIVEAVEVLHKELKVYAKKNKESFVRQVTIKLYSNLLIENIESSRAELVGSGAVKAHIALTKEIQKAFTVLLNSCAAYGKEYSTNNIPLPVIENFVAQLLVKVRK